MFSKENNKRLREERLQNRRLNQIKNFNNKWGNIKELILLYKSKILECKEIFINEFDITEEQLIEYYGEKYIVEN